MKVRVIRKVLLGLTFAATVATVSTIVWKVVQKNNLEVEAKSNNKRYKPFEIPKQDYEKLMLYKNSTFQFDLPNLEYYLVTKTLSIYPELNNKQFSFRVDNYHRPKAIEMSIDTQNTLQWFYSII